MNSAISQANDLYRMGVAGANGMNRFMQRSFLDRSIQIYISERKKMGDNVALLKNQGMAHFHLGQLHDDVNLIMHHLEEAVRCLTSAWLEQQTELREGEWGQNVEGNIASCFEFALKSMEVTAPPDQLPKYQILDRIVKIFERKELHPFHDQYRFAKGYYFYRMGIKAMDGAHFMKTLQLVENVRHEIHSLRMFYYSDDDIDGSIAKYESMKSLEEDVAFLALSCEAVRYRVQADNLFDNYVHQSEELNMDMIWEVLDMYKASGLCCREVDIENEAIALSRQGRVHDRIFKLRTKAHEYYRSAFDLSQCISPSELAKKDWFKECKEALERFQKEIVREEEERREKEKAPYLEKMSAILAGLKAVHMLEDAYKLMKYVYSTHPPKCKFTYDEKLVTSQNAKKILMTAITHYHPDKQVDQDMEWRILCEEITKCLTVRYEAFK